MDHEGQIIESDVNLLSQEDISGEEDDSEEYDGKAFYSDDEEDDVDDLEESDEEDNESEEDEPGKSFNSELKKHIK